MSFRSQYRDVGQLTSCTEAPILAATATATKEIQQDISSVLHLSPMTVMVFQIPERKNIFIHFKG